MNSIALSLLSLDPEWILASLTCCYLAIRPSSVRSAAQTLATRPFANTFGLAWTAESESDPWEKLHRALSFGTTSEKYERSLGASAL